VDCICHTYCHTYYMADMDDNNMWRSTSIAYFVQGELQQMHYAAIHFLKTCSKVEIKFPDGWKVDSQLESRIKHCAGCLSSDTISVAVADDAPEASMNKVLDVLVVILDHLEKQKRSGRSLVEGIEIVFCK